MSQNGVKVFPNFRGENSKYLSWHHPDVEYKNQQKQGKIEPHTWIFLLDVCKIHLPKFTNQWHKAGILYQ